MRATKAVDSDDGEGALRIAPNSVTNPAPPARDRRTAERNAMSDLGFLELRGRRIKEDGRAYLCLNDLQELADAPDTKAPSKWRALPTTKALERALEQNSRFSAIIAETPSKSAAYSKRGKSGGTFAHHIIALAYAEYLNEELAIEVKDTYIRLRSGDVEFLDEVLQRADEAKRWQGTRDASKAARERFTEVLAAHDCDGSDIGYVTNAIYVTLLGGKAAQVKQRLNLPAKANLRDNLDLKSLVQTMATEVMASERIEEEGRRGRYECYDATARSAGFIQDAFEKERADRKPKET
jgi:hypothetical protein